MLSKISIHFDDILKMFWCRAVRKNENLVRTFGIVFFLPGASQNAPSGHDPLNIVSFFGKSTIS